MLEPRASKPARAIRAISVGHLQSRLFEATRMPDIVPFGGAAPGVALLPVTKLNRILASVARSAGERGVSYDPPPGAEPLRREIAKRALDAGSHISQDEIITTSGGTEALMLCLRAVTKPGDVVAVESPAYFGVLHAMEELGLKALELPMHPRDGMDLDAFESLLKKHSIAACVAVLTFSNPLGALMPDENKQRLVALLARHEVPLIEDDIFGELFWHSTTARGPFLRHSRLGAVMQLVFQNPRSRLPRRLDPPGPLSSQDSNPETHQHPGHRHPARTCHRRVSGQRRI